MAAFFYQCHLGTQVFIKKQKRFLHPFIGIAALLYGWLPRIGSILNWIILGVWIFVEMLWEVGIVGWSAMQWTPFAHAHYIIPIHELPVMPLIVLTVIAAALSDIGLWRFNHRSIC